jgi:UDP-N-acetyl-D-mannosaminuronic acid transferase (WecB/TagA/CpsF family)
MEFERSGGSKRTKRAGVNASKEVFMRCEIFDCPIDVLTMAETIAVVREAAQIRKPTMHVALNGRQACEYATKV